VNLFFKKYWVYIAYALLTLAVTWPFFSSSGFVFLLDGSWGPNLDLADSLRDGINSGLPLTAAIKLLSFVIPLAFLHKVLLSLMLFLPAVFMYRLAQVFMSRELAFVSGVFYMCNPWVLERFVAGQWLVLLGYAFMPFLVVLYLRLLAKPNRNNYFKFALMFAIFPLLSLHFAYISAGLLGAVSLVYLFLNRSSKNWGFYFRFLKYGGIALVFFMLVNSFWIFNFNDPTATLPRITFDDFRAYQTMSDVTWGPYFNVVSLYGFWNQEVVLPKDVNPFWWVNTFIILLFSLFGMYYLVRKKSPLAITLAILYIPVVVASVGLVSPLGEAFVQSLYQYVPMFKGLRDTEKLSGVIAFTYALCVPMGAHLMYLILSNYKAEYKKIFMGVLYAVMLFIPLASTFSIFSGVNGYVPVGRYPEGWYQAEAALRRDMDSGKVLVLPWRGYMNMSFADMHLISNPAQRFFTPELIVSRNEGNDNLAETHNSPWDQKIFQIIQGFETIDENIAYLKGEGVGHIMLLKEADYERYSAILEISQGIQKVLDSERLVLFEVK